MKNERGPHLLQLRVSASTALLDLQPPCTLSALRVPAATGWAARDRPRQRSHGRRAQRQRHRRAEQVCPPPLQLDSRSSRQPAPPLPACRAHLDAPRPCCRNTWSVVPKCQEHTRSTFDVRMLVAARGMLCCLWVQGCTEAAAGDDGFVACAHRAGIVRAGCTDKSHTDSVCVRGAPIELCSPPCVPCRASRPAHFLRRCVGRASKLECCTSAVVVFYHLPTPRLVGCDDAARRRRQRDRPFRHSYTIVPTPCTAMRTCPIQ